MFEEAPVRISAILLVAALTLGSGTPATASEVPVLVYSDGNGSSLTDLLQGLDTHDTPLAAVTVRLLGGGDPGTLATDMDGAATFTDVDDGLRLVYPLVEPAAPCTSRNLASRLPALLESGAAAMLYVALGDSTPAYGAAKTYPVRLGNILSGLFPAIDTWNLAESGSKTVDWLPGNWAFEKARTQIEKADLVTISLGGNDLDELIDVLDFSNIDVAMQMALDLIDETMANAEVIVGTIRDINPHADVVWTIYPNYARSDQFLQYVPGQYIGLVESALEMAIGLMRDKLAAIEGLLLADTYQEWSDEDINPYMWDPIHLNDNGAESYARVIFRTLGGVFLPEDDGRLRSFSFDTDAPPLPEPVPEALPDVVAEPPQELIPESMPDSGPSEVPAESGGADCLDCGGADQEPGTESSHCAAVAHGGTTSPWPLLMLALCGLCCLVVRRKAFQFPPRTINPR